MKIRIAAPQLKQMVDDYLSRGDIRSASSLLKRNSDTLQKEFPDWYNKTVSDTKPKKDTRGRIKLICDYNEEIKEAAHNGDLKWLSRIRSDAYSKYERNRISEDEYQKICATIDTHIKNIKYSPIFSLIRTNIHPEDWKKYIDKNRTITAHDHIIIDEILRVSRKRIDNALSSKKYDSISKYVRALRDNFFDTKYASSNSLLLGAIDEKNYTDLESLLIDVVDNKLYKYGGDERFTIERSLEDLDIINGSMKKVFQEKRRLRTIGKIKSALAHFDFALADSYGMVDGFDYKGEKEAFVDKLKQKIYHDYDWRTDSSSSNDLAAKAMDDGALTYDEYVGILATAKEDNRADQKEKILQIILDLLNTNSSIYEVFSRALQRERLDYEDFKIPLDGFYPEYDSIYYDSHHENSIYNDNECPFTIADALSDGVIDIDSLKAINNDIGERKEKAALEYRRKMEEERRLREAEIIRERAVGIEPIDHDVITNNHLIELEHIDGMSFGFCMDLFTTSSTMNDDGSFTNEYSELGQMIHDLKYKSSSDFNKKCLIRDKLVPIILDRTKYFSFWDKNIVIIPMPFSKPRSLQPVFEIAKQLSQMKHKKYDDSILHKNSTIEAKTSDEEFADGVFVASYYGPETSVLIIDDTYGRGRSIRAAIRALRKNANIKFIYYLGIVKNRSGGLLR